MIKDATESGSDLSPVRLLLRSYREYLQLIDGLFPPSVRQTELLSRVGYRMRGRLGGNYFALEHVRRNVQELRRHYAMRLAIGESDHNDEIDSQALDRFADALPPSHRRIWFLTIVLFSFAIMQLGTPILTDFADEDKAVLEQVSQIFNLNPTQLGKALDALIHSSIPVVSDVFAIATLAVYLVLRPLVPGFRLAVALRNVPDVRCYRRLEPSILEAARRLTVHDRERALSAHFGIRLRKDIWFDLGVAALFWVLWLQGAAYFFLYPEERDLRIGAFFTGLTVVGLFFLSRKVYRRYHAT